MRARERDKAVATIAASASLSDAVGTGGLELAAIITPSGWDAADITFQAKYDGSTYVNVYDHDDAEVVIDAAASRFITIPAGTLNGATSIKVRSGTSASAVNQADEVEVTLIFATAV